MSTVTAIYDDTYDLGHAVTTAFNELSNKLVQESVVLQANTASGFVEVEIAGATNQPNIPIGEVTVRPLFSATGGAEDKLFQGHSFLVKTPGYGPFTFRSDLLLLPGGGTLHVTFQPIYSVGIVTPYQHKIEVENSITGSKTTLMVPTHGRFVWEGLGNTYHNEVVCIYITEAEAAATPSDFTEGAGWYLFEAVTKPYDSRQQILDTWPAQNRGYGFGAVPLHGKEFPDGSPWNAAWRDWGDANSSVEAEIAEGWWRPGAAVDLTIRVIEL